MYTLLVVDDEQFAVQGITRGIEWDDIHIGSIFEAYDATEAMEILQKNHVDIMITDVEMPGCNGLELSDWLRKNSPQTQTIFLTGHAEFSYAQKALQLGSLGYVLKPVDHDQLKELVKTAIGKIEKEEESRNFNVLYQKYLRRWEAHLPMMIENFWRDVLESKISLYPEKLEFLMSQYKIPLHPQEEILPVLISIESWKEEFNTKDEEVMEFAVQNAASDILLEGIPGNVIQNYSGAVLVLLYNSADTKVSREELLKLCKDRCQQFIETCDQCFYAVVSCYIGEPTDIYGLGENCRWLLEMESGNVKSRQKVLCQMAVKEEANPTNAIPWFPDWYPLFELGKKDELMQRVKKLFMDLDAEDQVSRETLAEIYHGISYMIYNVVHKKNLEAHRHSENISNEEVMRSLSRLKAWVYKVIPAYVQYITESSKQESALIDKVKQYISDHICEEFTREDIAKNVYLNPAYLSRVFKNETGFSLSDYISQVRMERARVMLAESNLSISAVAEDVGYFNFSHFSKMFKRFIGVTPSEYRKKFQSSDE